MRLQTKYPFLPRPRLVYSAPWYKWITLEGWSWIVVVLITIAIFAVPYALRP